MVRVSDNQCPRPQSFWREFQHRNAGARRSESGDEFADERRGARHHAAKRRAFGPGAADKLARQPRRGAAKPFRGGNVGLLHHPPTICQAEMRVRVADVEE